MKIELEFLRSKVARRVFVLFFISSLVPVILLSLLSLNEVNTLLIEQHYEQLRQTNKKYGLALLDRLFLLRTQLDWIAEHGELAEDTSLASRMRWIAGQKGLGLRDIRVLPQPDPTEPAASDSSSLAELMRREPAFFAAGNTLLFTETPAQPSSRIYLARLLRPRSPEPGVMLAEIDRAYLFGDGNAFAQDSRLCVLDDGNRTLFCSQADFEPSDEERHRIAQASSGHFLTADGDGQEYLTSYWSVFLKPNFLVRQWTVVSRVTKTSALLSVTNFRYIFGVVIGLTLATIALLSVFQIRRSLVPLERIMEGVHRIANKDFTHPVSVESGDEFEELARSFNRMTETLDKQFHTLSTMAEIDQLILSTLKIDDIVQIVLTRMLEVIPHHHINMTILDDAGQASCHSHRHTGLGKHAIQVSALEIDAHEIAVLKEQPYRVIEASNDPLPSYLQTLIHFGAHAFMILPITVKDELAAIICLGYETICPLAAEDIDLARDFANRVAVALANASWEEQLYALAHYDTLTGLANRLLLKDRLRHALASAERQKSFVAVLFIDLDRFKNVNDSLGHISGDFLLREVAARLMRILREEDTVARLGGDEFVIVIQHFALRDESLDLTSRIAQKILFELSKPFVINDREIVSTASIGIACYPTDGSTATELLKNADAAMYHAKSLGKDTYQFYSGILNAEALERLDLENALRHALSRNELRIFYQPKVDTRSGKIRGAEALLRWQHPRKGMISPAQFIPICEEIGLIIPIGEWVIRGVCMQIKQWIDQGYPALRVAVNLSPIQFRQPDLIEMVVKALAETGLDASHLELEITEGAAMENIERTLLTLSRFHALDIPLSIDDFGTGHSSLSYLKRFPLSTLKIDQSFIRNISESAKDEAIVKSIITLAHSLGFSVVAEGVETREQLDYLAHLDCDLIQGYLFSPPVPPEKLVTWFAPRP